MRRRRGSVRPRARRGRPRRQSRADGRAREASAPSLACGAPGGVPSRERERDAVPSPVEKARLRGRAASPATGRDFRKLKWRKVENLGAKDVTGRLWQGFAPNGLGLEQHTARVRAAGFRASRRARRVRDATPCPRRAVSPRGARRRFPPRRARPCLTQHLVLFCYLAHALRDLLSRERKRGGETALSADVSPWRLTRPPPGRPVRPAAARAPSSRAPRPSGAAAPPRPRARASAHRKTDGRKTRKRPSQRRGSRRTAPRGGRACRAEKSVKKNRGA